MVRRKKNTPQKEEIEDVVIDEEIVSTPAPSPVRKRKPRQKKTATKTKSKPPLSGEENDSGNDGDDEKEVKKPEPKSKPKPKARTKKVPVKSAPKTVKKPSRVTKTAPKKVESEEQPESSSKRHFQVIADSIDPPIDLEKLSASGGRYGGKAPCQAAKKAYNKFVRNGAKNNDDDDDVNEDGMLDVYTFSIKEITRGSPGRVFSYTGYRQLLEEPREIKRGETTYFVRYDTKVKSLRGQS